MKQIDYYNSLIKPIRDKKINSIIKQLNYNDLSPYDKNFTWNERIDKIELLKENTLNWAKNYLHGLNNFPFVYVMNGNTDSLNYIFNSCNSVMSWKHGDYGYYEMWHKNFKKQYKVLNESTDCEELIVTWPGFSYGNSIELNFIKTIKSKRKHLDCAYLGLTIPQSIDVSDFNTVSISFSKSFAIPYNRVGLLYSKEELPCISFMNKIGYVNLSGVVLSNKLITTLPLNYWWDTYGGKKLENLCKKNNLEKTDSVLFAYNKKNRISIAEYWNKINSN